MDKIILPILKMQVSVKTRVIQSVFQRMRILLNYMLNNNNIQWEWLGHAAALFLCVSEILVFSK